MGPSAPTADEDRIRSLVDGWLVYRATSATLADYAQALVAGANAALFLDAIRAMARCKAPLEERGACLVGLLEGRRRGAWTSYRQALEAEGFPVFHLCVMLSRTSLKRARGWAQRLGYPDPLVGALQTGGRLLVGEGVTCIPPCAPSVLEATDAPLETLDGLDVGQALRLTRCPALRSVRDVRVRGEAVLSDLPNLEDAGSLAIVRARVTLSGCPRLAAIAVVEPVTLTVEGCPLLGGLAVFGLGEGGTDLSADARAEVLEALRLTGVAGPILLPGGVHGQVAIEACPGFLGFAGPAEILNALLVAECPALEALAARCQGNLAVLGCDRLRSLSVDLAFMSAAMSRLSQSARATTFPRDGNIDIQIADCPSLVWLRSSRGGGLVVLSLLVRGCPKLVAFPDWMDDLVRLDNPSFVRM
jgi:hypothetical protein